MRSIATLVLLLLSPVLATHGEGGLSVTVGPVAHSLGGQALTPGIAVGYEGRLDLGTVSVAWSTANTSFETSSRGMVVTLHAGPGRVWNEGEVATSFHGGPSVALSLPLHSGSSQWFVGAAVLAERRWWLSQDWSWSLGVASSLYWLSIAESGALRYPINDFWLEPRVSVSWQR